MTWDATIHAVTRTPHAFPDDFDPMPMGLVDDVKSRISHALPGVLWSGASGHFSDGTLHAELTLWGTHAPALSGFVDRVAVSALGNAHLVPLLSALCIHHGWVAIDDGTGTLVDLGAEPHARVNTAATSGNARRRTIRFFIHDDARKVRALFTDVLGVTIERGPNIVGGPEYRLELEVPDVGRVETLRVYAIGAGVDGIIARISAASGWTSVDER